MYEDDESTNANNEHQEWLEKKSYYEIENTQEYFQGCILPLNGTIYCLKNIITFSYKIMLYQGS